MLQTIVTFMLFEFRRQSWLAGLTPALTDTFFLVSPCPVVDLQVQDHSFTLSRRAVTTAHHLHLLSTSGACLSLSLPARRCQRFRTATRRRAYWRLAALRNRLPSFPCLRRWPSVAPQKQLLHPVVARFARALTLLSHAPAPGPSNLWRQTTHRFSNRETPPPQIGARLNAATTKRSWRPPLAALHAFLAAVRWPVLACPVALTVRLLSARVLGTYVFLS